MKEKNVFLSLVIITVLFTVVLFTGLGYANENGINSKVNNFSDSEFNVEFNKNSNLLNNTITIIDSRTVALNDITLSKVGEIQKFLIPVINNSTISAKLSANIENTNPEFFEVTCNISKSTLKPQSDEAVIEVIVELKKSPLYSTENSNIAINITADPIF